MKYFAIKLKRVAISKSSTNDDDNELRTFLSHQSDWLNCLAAETDIRFDLRFGCRPSGQHYKRGEIRIALIGAVEPTVRTPIEEISRHYLNLCSTFFEKTHEFEQVTLSDELMTIRKPFEIESIAEISRRIQMIRLDTFRSENGGRQFGFIHQMQDRTADQTPVEILHVCPFVYNSASLQNLFNLMLMQNFSMGISFGLQKTRLSESEFCTIEDQIRLCETFAQSGFAGNVARLEKLSPTLQERARLLQRHLTTKLYGLMSSAVAMRIRLFSEGSIPKTLVDVLGSNLSLPAGGMGDSGTESFLYGGYDSRILEHNEVLQARADLENISLGEDALECQERLRLLFETKEASAVFALPRPPKEELAGVATRSYATKLIPPNCEAEGIYLGDSVHNGSSIQVRLDDDTRRRHLYTVGQTGTGKSTLFESMILSDIKAGKCVCFIDPHGETAESLLTKIPVERAADVIYFDAGDTERPFGINILEHDSEEQKHFLIQELMAIVKRIVREYDPSTIGPIFMQHTRMVLQLVMSNPEKAGTLLQFYQVFCSSDFYRNFLPLRSKDPLLRSFVEETLSRTDYTRQGSESVSLGSYISSKYEPFFGDPLMRNIFGQTKSSFSIEDIIRKKEILIVNLSKGKLGDLNSQFLGMVLIAKLQSAVMGQARLASADREDLYLYVDEFQNLATENFSSILAEARKYKLNLALANQFVSQLDNNIREAIMGNVGTTISFRVGSTDAELLEQDLKPAFDRFDLMNLPNFNAYVTTLSKNEVCAPFSMKTAYDRTVPDFEFGEDLKELSREFYGRLKDDVEREIDASLSRFEIESSGEFKLHDGFGDF